MDPNRPWPRWLTLLASVAVVLHLLAVLLVAVATPSGPWPTAYGADMAEGPYFAQPLSETAVESYLTPLKMTHNYHFLRNRPAQPVARFEVRLRDDEGNVFRSLQFPDPHASFWTRHRQALLAMALADDQLVQPPGGEAIPAPNTAVRTTLIWDIASDSSLVLKEVPEHLVPRDRMVYQPSQRSLIRARSYVRHLCREHGAASASLTRYTREAAMPAVLGTKDIPPEVVVDLVAHFGEMKK